MDQAVRGMSLNFSLSSPLSPPASPSSLRCLFFIIKDPGQYGLICKSFELSNVVVYLAEVSQTETNGMIALI